MSHHTKGFWSSSCLPFTALSKEEAAAGEGADLQVTGAGLLSGGRSEDAASHQDSHESAASSAAASSSRSPGTITPASFRKSAAKTVAASQ